jgi:hypothetical protein
MSGWLTNKHSRGILPGIIRDLGGIGANTPKVCHRAGCIISVTGKEGLKLL